MSQPETPLIPEPLAPYSSTEVAALRAEVATLTGQLAHWQTCSNCGKKMSAPGICDDAVTEREKGLGLMHAETLTRAEAAEAEVATLRQQEQEASHSADPAEARLAAQAEALETLEQTEQKIRAWQVSSMTGYDTALELLCEVADALAALRTTSEESHGR